jgi:hypothetical protein
VWTLVATMSTPNHAKLVSNRDGSVDNQIWHVKHFKPDDMA